ncbi:unnamed protein product [Closterium sp. NIES-64]|nr:unnamed protein product [Closterium sp. NIES-64]
MAICCLGSVSNYLIGTVPALATGLRTLDLRLNFLTDLPVVAYFWCGGSTKCLASLSKYSSAGTAQHPVAECAYCGTKSVPPLCWGAGGVCSVNASATVAAGTVSSSLQLVLPRTCVGSPVVGLKDTAGLMRVGGKGVLSRQVSKGVFEQAGEQGGVRAVARNVTGGVCAMTVAFCDGGGGRGGAWGSVHRAYPTLSLLPNSSLSPPPFPHPLPCPCSSVGYNYLTGAFPAVPATTKALDVQSNFLSAAFPTNTLTYCAATTNCLTNANNYASLGIAQRSAADCAICGTDSGQGTLCGGVPCLVNTTRVTAPITASSPTRNLYYTPVAMDANTTTTLLALESVLGVTAADWSATTVALQPKALKGGSVPMASTVDAYTVEGQAPTPGSCIG